MIETPTTTEIRAVTIAQLPLCVEHARAFHREKQLPGDLIPSVFLKNWETFLSSYPAVVLGLWVGDEIAGALAAMITPDLSDGRITATEMFWYQRPEYRLGLDAFKLIDAFESWGDEHGAVEFRLVHMLMPNEDPSTVRLAPIYKRRKYQPLEVGYYKPNPKRSHPCPS